MKNKLTTLCIALIGCLVFVQCDKQEGIKLIPPKSVTLLAGNNQSGYADEALSDSIVIEVVPGNIEDLPYYTYDFSDSGRNIYYDYSEIRDNKLYITAYWRLNDTPAHQELKCYLSYKYYLNSHRQLKLIDSLTINASVKIKWEKILSNIQGELYDIYFSDDDNGILIGDLAYGTGYLITNDMGNTWNYTNKKYYQLFHLSFADKDTGIATTYGNRAYITTDGGQSFQTNNWTPPFSGNPKAEDFHMFNSNEIITVGKLGKIAKTTDAGKSWTNYTGFTFQNALYDITSVDNNICYACGEIAKVIKTTDRGITWEEQDVLSNNYLKTIYFINKDFGFAGGQSGALIRTTNGGEDWNIITTGFRSTIIEIYFSSISTGYIFSTSGEIAKTINGGETWHKINKAYMNVSFFNKVLVHNNIAFGLENNTVYTYNLEDE